MRSIRKIGKLVDSYLQAVATDINLPVSKVLSVAEALPDIARKDHDDLYRAINIYLKVKKLYAIYVTKIKSSSPVQQLNNFHALMLFMFYLSYYIHALLCSIKTEAS
jgi:hypothetical protein